jgi:uncharacterized protein YkwD
VRASLRSSGLAILLLALGCGGSTRNVESLPGERIVAPSPAAAEYRTTADDRGAQGERATHIEAALHSSATDAGRTLRGDSRLATLAQWVAEHAVEGESIRQEVVSFFTHHLGLVEQPHFLLQTTTGLTHEMSDELGAAFGRRPYTHYGIAVVQQEGQNLAIVALSTRPANLEPLSRTQAPGSLSIQGALTEGYERPVLALTRPSGVTERVPMGSGPSFLTQVPAEIPGTYQVEVLAYGPLGLTVVANAPVFVGVEPPTYVELRAVGAGEAGNVEAVGVSLLELINESRGTRGLNPLERMTSLDAVAHSHSEDMRDNDFTGHRSPTHGDTAERIAGAGIQSGLILENIGRGYGAAEIHASLMQSPGHRANILNEQTTHIGIGVTQAERDRAFLATQLFIRVSREIDPDETQTQLLAAINRAREARGAPALELEDNLAQAARGAAEQFFSDPAATQQSVVDDASRGLRRFAVAFRRVSGLMTVVGDPREAEHLEPTFDPEVRFVGIGVAQGTRADSPPNSIGVVILLAWPR